jgi:TRAP-type C4-dicarboxylate transport system permease small subunit
VDHFVRIVRLISRLCGYVAAALIAVSVVVVCEMVFVRFVLNQNTIWQTDFVTYSLVAATFIGSPFVLMTRGHVNVDVLPLYVGPRTRYWLALCTMLLALTFCVVLFVLCTAYWYEAWTKDWHSDTVWRAPLWVPYIVMPIGLGLLVLQYIAELLSLVTGRAPPFGIPDKASAEEVARELAREALGGAG